MSVFVLRGKGMPALCDITNGSVAGLSAPLSKTEV